MIQKTRKKSLISGYTLAVVVGSAIGLTHCGPDPVFCDRWGTPQTLTGGAAIDACGVTYSSCSDHRIYEVTCGEVGSASACICYINNVQVGSFSSQNFCDTNGSATKGMANQGCGWDIGG